MRKLEGLPEQYGWPAQVLDWNEFDVFTVARISRGRPLQTVTWALLQHFDLIDSLNLPPDKLRRFLKVCIQPQTLHRWCVAETP